MDLNHLLPFLALIAIPAVLGLVFYLTQKRRKEVEQMALSCGLTLDPDAAGLPELGNEGMELFKRGHSRKYRNLIPSYGAGAEKVYFFDYSYVTGGGRHHSTHKFTAACFEFSQPIFPAFTLGPENFMDKLADMLGFPDIDIDGFPAFSKQYKLTGLDKSAVLAFFGPQTVNFFEQNPGWRVQASGRRIVVFKNEGFMPASAYQAYMEETKNLVSSIAKE